MSVTKLSAARRVSTSNVGLLHPEAVDWSARVATNSGTVSHSTLLAVSQFCRAIDAESGLRSAILRCNLICGNELAAALVPLYRGASLTGSQLGNTTDTNNGPFVSGDYAETGSSGGLKGNGTSKHLATGLGTSALSSLNSSHLSISATSLETTTVTSGLLMIGTDSTGGNGVFDIGLLNYGTPANARGMRLFSGSNYPYFAVTATTRGSTEPHMIATRTSSSLATLYGSGSVVIQDTTTRSPSSTTNGIAVFATNANGTVSGFTAMRLRQYSVGNGLTAAQALAFSLAVMNFNSALGRAS